MTGRGPGRPATGVTTPRSIRSGAVWDQAAAIAATNGETIKAVIERKLEEYIVENTLPVLLDRGREDNDTPAYLCGRLASVLHDLEYAATEDHTAWYQLFPQTIANGELALRWADSRAADWLRRIDPQRAAHYRHEIDRLTQRIGAPGVLAGAENGNWVSLGFHHQGAAAERQDKLAD